MRSFITNLDHATIENTDFRRVLYTAKHCQLVLMALAPGEEIGEEVHDLDQFIRIEQGEGKAVLNGKEQALTDGSAVLVPEGARHNIINTGVTAMKLYTVYAPPEHRDKVVHRTKSDALADTTDEFDGKTTE